VRRRAGADDRAITTRKQGHLAGHARARLHTRDRGGVVCRMLLADLGADVVKIEPPAGEVTRTAVGPFRAYDFVNRNEARATMG